MPQITDTVNSLMKGPIGQTRKKAIITLAKRKSLSLNDSRFYQATRISQAQSRKQNG